MIPEVDLNRKVFALAQNVIAGNTDKVYINGYRDAIKDVFEIIAELEEEEFIRRQEEGLRAIYDALEEDGYY